MAKSTYFISQWIRHRLKAKGRHGVHSPFVYDFVEQILNRRFNIPTGFFEAPSGVITGRQAELLNYLSAYYHLTPALPHDIADVRQQEYQGLLFCTPPRLLDWPVSQQDMILVTGIHESREQTERWHDMVNDKSVTLSLTLFNAGLLLFRKDFKIKQHFNLKG